MKNKKQIGIEEYYQRIRENKRSNIHKMQEEAEELLRYSYQSDDTYGQAFACLHLAIYYIWIHKFESAQFNLAKVETLCLRDGYPILLLSCYRYQGTICQLNGDKIKAIRIYGKAMNLAENLKEDHIIAVLYNNIAIILMEYKDMNLAKEYFERAVDKFLLHFKNDKVVYVYANLVQVCCALGRSRLARAYLAKANAIDYNSNKASSALKVSTILLYAHEQETTKVIQAYEEYMRFFMRCTQAQTTLIEDLFVLAESLRIAHAKEACFTVCNKLVKMIENDHPERELSLYKLLIAYQETFAEEDLQIYERYYHLLIQSEDQEYHSLAESLRGRIELSEWNQKQSILEQENEVLQKQAHLDEMTGAYNRRYFDKLLLKMTADKDVHRIGCIMLDVDRFKEYNDTYGHLQGDQILMCIVDTLMKHTSEGISIGRFGGDEFYCLCANLQDKQIEQFLSDVYEDLHTQHVTHEKNEGLIVTLSAGFWNGSKSGITLHDVLNHADQALYEAKKKGRNTFVKYHR